MKVIMFRQKNLKYFYFVAAIFSLSLVLLSLMKINLSDDDALQTALPFADSASAGTPYKILIWDVGKRMSRRFLRSFGDANKDPFAFCSVRNCVLETSNDKIGEADAVMFHLHLTKGPGTLPKFRKPHQFWIFFTDESPLHTFLLTRRYNMSHYNGIFNLSMTYRSDSDVPVPYGRTVQLSEPPLGSAATLRNFSAAKTKLVAILSSNCGGPNKRWPYIRELSKHVAVDVYGGCGTKVCPGHFTRDCDVTKQYKFYLAFENSNCREYITEKLWWNAYEKEIVPVVMGASKEEYSRLAPPHSFIHVEDFTSPEDLARYLVYLDTNASAYNEYFAWKTKYQVRNEHGYFGSPSLHLCRMCEAVNRFQGTSKVYNNLESFWNPRTDCRPPVWDPTYEK
uniref:Fucosyltransferase n=1 Tax=Amblyomma triste TaxID=251400 RepID=A0A023GFR3_AMBTT